MGCHCLLWSRMGRPLYPPLEKPTVTMRPSPSSKFYLDIKPLFHICQCLSTSEAPKHEFRRRRWHPTPVLLPGKSHGQRSLVGCSPWGCEESDTTERLHFHFSLSCTGEGNGNTSSVLAWRIPGTGEPGGLPSMGSHRVGHD